MTVEEKIAKVRDLRPIDDGSDIADLMSCFEKKKVNNKKFPKFSQRVANLKTTEGGATAVCDVMKHYEDIARTEGRLQTIAEFLANGGTEEDANRLLKASPEEIANAKELLVIA